MYNAITDTLHKLGLSNKPVCLHSSLRSFGWVEGGAKAIIKGFLDLGCTILVPTFSYDFSVVPPENLRPARNGCGDYSWCMNEESNDKIYTCETNQVDTDMGAIPKSILTMKGRKRGNHPLNSFASIGPLAKELISEQSPTNVYGPLKKLVELNGSVILMGVGLERLTLLHLAEEMAGRQLFRRWAKDTNGSTILVEVGGCSEGFHKLDQLVSGMTKNVTVDKSFWRIFNTKSILDVTQLAIKENPLITHCGNFDCERCNDAVQGGPILL
ncbi:AAC(3) family N-acetyltransferase [Halalkalibacter hemicellulosilyticus]|uniref:Aminoglycoside N(3)-acetyltransferase n=1 Tax=Halalkalibacter hemicellulosilyticusJCM 9152 TaxID=1236971 RepID=W4QDU6_9BACI|nr:AAC(3) family N-acetyltransferase [Halalkalibacter hemicellulosilyticus]GAE30231.1 aminoglycoside N(3')-acetyltransferase [Halalkalibacter hemicellulosilyticusJCM 9152]